MKGSWLCYMVGATSLFLGLSVLMNQTSAYVTSFPDEPDIDGKLMTVGIAIAKYLAGLLPYSGVSTLIIAIIDAWLPKPEDNYWEQIRENVAEMCGEFINDHNLKQVEVYKGDLIELLHRYDRAPIIGDGTYPEKNMMANALHTSILTNRFLIEAAEMPWSMSIDFVDVSGVHILILKDAAETYSSPGLVSKWWDDLSGELNHYIKYGIMLQNVTKEWRDCQIECRIEKAPQACLDFRWMGITCYDKFEIIDHVSKHTEKCYQIHPDNPDQGSCINFCQNYQIHIDQASQKWFYQNVGSVVHEMEVLKVKADEMAKHVSMVDKAVVIDLILQDEANGTEYRQMSEKSNSSLANLSSQEELRGIEYLQIIQHLDCCPNSGCHHFSPAKGALIVVWAIFVSLAVKLS